jgi:hypothetical protein
MYTSRYNACDLNEMPEQLYEGRQSPILPPVLDLRHTLSCTILCNRIRIDARWEKSPARPHRTSASPPSSSRAKSGRHTRDAKQIQPHLGKVTPKPTKSSKRKRVGVRSHLVLPVVVVGVFVAVAGRLSSSSFNRVVRRVASRRSEAAAVAYRWALNRFGGGRQRLSSAAMSGTRSSPLGRIRVSFAVTVTVGARWNEDEEALFWRKDTNAVWVWAGLVCRGVSS